MKRIFLILAAAFFLAGYAKAQAVDSVLVNRYLTDTLNFIPCAQGYVIDSIKPDNNFTKWELATFTYFEGFRRRDEYPKVKLRPADSLVMLKSKTGFYTICPPSGCCWYMNAKNKKKVVSITDLATMSEFLGALDNQFDAYLWLASHDIADSRFVPLMTGQQIQWKMTNDGYLLRFPMRISDCPVTRGEVTFLVGFNKKVTHIKTKVLEVGVGCI